MTRFASLAFTSLVVLAACTEFPDLDRAISDAARRAAYPSLEPTDTLMFAPFSGRPGSTTEAAWLVARAAGLKARAQTLRGPVIATAERALMEAAVGRHFTPPAAPLQ